MAFGEGSVSSTPASGVPTGASKPRDAMHVERNENGQIVGILFDDPDPANGLVDPVFVDANGAPIETPSESELNSPPAPGSKCRAVAPQVNCPVVMSTPQVLCQTDADCGAGVCASLCGDSECTTVLRVCGALGLGCGGLPEAQNCTDYELEPIENSEGQVNEMLIDSQLAPLPGIPPEARIDPEDKDVVPLEFARLSSLSCVDLYAREEQAEQKAGKTWPSGDGNADWGFYVTPATDFKIYPKKRSDGLAQVEIGAYAGVEAGGIVYGERIAVVDVSGGVTVTDCGLDMGATLKIFGEAIVAWTPTAGDPFGLQTEGNSVGTDPTIQSRCERARLALSYSGTGIKIANANARAARGYIATHGFTPRLCDEAIAMYPDRWCKEESAEQDEFGQFKCAEPYDCSELNQIPLSAQIGMLNGFETTYTSMIQRHIELTEQLGLAREQVKVGGTLTLKEFPHPYHLSLVNQQIPLGPVVIDLVVDGLGQWNVKGGLQFGIATNEDISLPTEALAILGNQPTRLGDVAVFGGPVVTPSAGLGISMYAGVGIPGVSVGIEGTITILEVNLPLGAPVTAMRVSTPDERPLAGSDWDGDLIPGKPPLRYHWLTGFSWNAGVELAALTGQVNLAARVNLILYTHTYRRKLFNWTGIRKYYDLISDGVGAPLSDFGDFGEQADFMAYTESQPITEVPVVNQNDATPMPICTLE